MEVLNLNQCLMVMKQKFTKKALIHKDVKIFFDGDDKRYNRLLA